MQWVEDPPKPQAQSTASLMEGSRVEGDVVVDRHLKSPCLSEWLLNTDRGGGRCTFQRDQFSCKNGSRHHHRTLRGHFPNSFISHGPLRNGLGITRVGWTLLLLSSDLRPCQNSMKESES